jgi:hypothetical protein
MKIFDMLKSENKFERTENYCILFLLVGSVILSLGIGLTVISTKGISAILAMLGSLIAFLSTIALIFTWLIKELFGE